jgi:hypothetical protein
MAGCGNPEARVLTQDRFGLGIDGVRMTKWRKDMGPESIDEMMIITPC